MKKIAILTVLLFALLSVDAAVRWPFGAANTVTNQVNDTVDISGYLTRGLNYYDIDNDTTMVINVTTVSDDWAKGDLLIIEATEGTAAADTLRYGTNITGTEDPIPAGKTKVVTFIFNGTGFVKVAVTQID